MIGIKWAILIENLPSFCSFGKAVSEEKIFRNRPIRNKNCLWQPYLLMDRDEMINLYRGPPIDASYQVSVHLAKWFQRRRIFRNHPIRNKNCLWWPYLLTDRDEMSNHNRGLSIDASYQVSVHLAKQFQRRRILIFPIVFYFLLIFFTNFQVWEAATAIIHGLKENYICIVPL